MCLVTAVHNRETVAAGERTRRKMKEIPSVQMIFRKDLGMPVSKLRISPVTGCFRVRVLA